MAKRVKICAFCHVKDSGVQSPGSLIAVSGFVSMPFSLTKHLPLIIKAALISLILHYLFVMYFPMEWFEKTGLFNHSQTGQFYAKARPLEFRLLHDGGDTGSDDAMAEGEGEQDGAGEGGTGLGGLQGVDEEKWGDLLQRLETNTGFKNDFANAYDDLIQNSKVSSNYIQRDRMHEDIVIKEVFPTIHSLNESFEDMLKVAPVQLSEFETRNEIIQQFRNRNSQHTMTLTIESSASENTGNLGPLVFPPAERQKFFDESIGFDKSKQLARFINRYFQYDPNEGDLPAATRELYYQNLERLLYTFSHDPTYLFLDFYLENLNKEEFLQHALYQASRLSGSKTATELLFAIEAIYEIQQRTWHAYFHFDELYQTLPPEKKARLRIETLRRVNERYKAILQEKGLQDLSEIDNKYRQRRLEIINHLIRNTPDGYRLHDAQFHRGILLWEMGMQNNDAEIKQQAIAQWQTLLNEVKANAYSENLYKDFQHLEHMPLLNALLMAYQKDMPAMKPLREKQINEFLMQRQSKRLAEKQEREEKLLWPRD